MAEGRLHARASLSLVLELRLCPATRRAPRGEVWCGHVRMRVDKFADEATLCGVVRYALRVLERARG